MVIIPKKIILKLYLSQLRKFCLFENEVNVFPFQSEWILENQKNREWDKIAASCKRDPWLWGGEPLTYAGDLAAMKTCYAKPRYK